MIERRVESSWRDTGRTGLRLVAVLGCLLAGSANFGAAHAADGSARRILGFSPDGRNFAFAQSGVQDGSGYPYADVFVIDTRNDAYASPPVHVLLKNDAATRTQAETEALRQAKATLAAKNIGTTGRRIGIVATSRPGDELGQADAMKGEESAASVMVLNAPELGDDPKLALKPILFDLPRCKDVIDPPAHLSGFALSLTRRGRSASVLHKDTQVPESRYCPRRYGLSEAHLLVPKTGAAVMAVLVEVYTPGFEGPDRRFVAVTAQVAK